MEKIKMFLRGEIAIYVSGALVSDQKPLRLGKIKAYKASLFALGLPYSEIMAIQWSHVGDKSSTYPELL